MRASKAADVRSACPWSGNAWSFAYHCWSIFAGAAPDRRGSRHRSREWASGRSRCPSLCRWVARLDHRITRAGCAVARGGRRDFQECWRSSQYGGHRRRCSLGSPIIAETLFTEKRWQLKLCELLGEQPIRISVTWGLNALGVIQSAVGPLDEAVAHLKTVCSMCPPIRHFACKRAPAVYWDGVFYAKAS